MHFFINTKTQKIHSANCSTLPKKLGISSVFYTDFKLYINLGFHRNLESVIMMGISKGYINTRCSSCCCASIDW